MVGGELADARVAGAGIQIRPDARIYGSLSHVCYWCVTNLIGLAAGWEGEAPDDLGDLEAIVALCGG